MACGHQIPLRGLGHSQDRRGRLPAALRVGMDVSCPYGGGSGGAATRTEGLRLARAWPLLASALPALDRPPLLALLAGQPEDLVDHHPVPDNCPLADPQP